MSNNWLQELKAGDPVIVGGNYTTHLMEVERVTKTQILIKNMNGRFRRDTGWLKGASQWNSTSLSEATPEVIEKLRKKKYRARVLSKVSDFDFRTLSTQELTDIVNILNRAEAERKENDNTN